MKISTSHLITEGGDERLDILADGYNKYHINPLEYKNLFLRGSCTCSPLNPLTARLLDEDISRFENDYAEIRAEQTHRIKKLLNYEGEDKFGLIFGPSGSDLAYLPAMFSNILYPKKPIELLLTCPEELGSGSKMAYLGQYYAVRNQFGDETEKGEDINPHYDISMESFKARNDQGEINKHSADISQKIKENTKKSMIGALVIGSKSGIENDVTIIPKISDDVMWVVDLCQFRNSKKLVNKLLDMGCLVMITGSKFYMAPPFCGVLLVPKPLCEKINQAEIQKDLIKGFDKVFASYDFTEEFDNLATFFPKKKNKGLLLRWEIGLDEMERFNEIPREDSNGIITTWNTTVRACIAKSSSLELMPNQEKTNRSIISFRMKKSDGEYLDYDELKKLFAQITSEEHDLDRFKKIFMGQPVKYSCGAFIRVAVGAYNIHQLLKRPEETRFDNDRKLMHILDEKAYNFA